MYFSRCVKRGMDNLSTRSFHETLLTLGLSREDEQIYTPIKAK